MEFLFGLLVLALVSCILGVITFFIAKIVSRNQPKGRREILILSFLTPFIILFSELFVGGIINDVILGKCFNITGRFCSSIEAPINKNYRLAMDGESNNTWIASKNDHGICTGFFSNVDRLWEKKDTIFVLYENRDFQQDRTIKKYSLYAFPSQSEIYDEVCTLIDRGPMNSILQDRGLLMEDSITPENYLHKALLIPYIIEGVFRHSLVILLLVYLWVKTIRRAKR